MKTLIKVLIVEDLKMTVLAYKIALRENSYIDIEVLTASTVEEAKELYAQNKTDMSIIVMDADLGKGNIETIELTKYLKKTFKGPMIANSSEKLYNNKLIEAGCTDCSDSKDKCPEKIFEIIAQFSK